MYIGEKKVKDSKVEDGKVNVVFEDDSQATFTPKMFEASLSQEPLDATKLQERRIVAVQVSIMNVFLEWDMKLADISKLLQWSTNYLMDKHERADEKLWGNTFQERTIGDLEGVLLRREGNPTPSEGTVSDLGAEG